MMNHLKDLFLNQLRDAYSAETQITQALPKMEAAAHSPELKAAFKQHLAETTNQVNRLEQIFKTMNASPSGETCEATQGLITEGQEIISQWGNAHVRDAGLICAAQKVEHYEMALYGSLSTWAGLLGDKASQSLLQQTLAEEKATDAKLTQLAESHLNELANV